MTNSPRFKFRGSSWAELLDPVIFETPIKGYLSASEHILLAHDGRLTLSPGFVWDFGSGAIDTPDMVYSSIAHDALYRLIKDCQLPRSERKNVDLYFKELLAKAGTPWWRRQYIYWAVRLLYPITRVFS